MDDPFDDPSLEISENAEMPAPSLEESAPDSRMGSVRARHEAALLAIDGVTGLDITVSDAGEPIFVIYVRDKQVASRLPRDLEGYPVTTQVTGPITAF